MQAKNDSFITLKHFSNDNVKMTFEWLQNAGLRQLFAMKKAPKWERHLEYIKKTLLDHTQIMFAIYYKDIHIGNCGLKYIQNREAAIWIYLGNENYKGKGLSKAACRQLISYAKEELNLSLLYLHVLKDNIVALNLYNTLGFKRVPLDDVGISIWKERSNSILKMILPFD